MKVMSARSLNHKMVSRLLFFLAAILHYVLVAVGSTTD
jgi:hypothetical protein